MLNHSVPETHTRYYVLVLAGMCAVILSALALEHIGGYIPCKLCLIQREPWYAGIPVAGLAFLSVFFKWPPYVSRGLMLVCALLMAYSMFLGIDHSGVEWGWWEGPSDCGAVDGGIAADTGNFLQQLETTVAPSCNDAALRIFGLSLAGWNAVASLFLGLVALAMATRKN